MTVRSRGREYYTAWSGKRQSWVWTGTYWRQTDNSIRSGQYFTADDSSTIAYDNSIRRGPIKKTRACSHSVENDFSCGPKTWQIFNNVSHTDKILYTNVVPFQEPEMVLPTPDSFDCSTFHLEALDFFKAGCVDQELDLFTNIYELKSLTSTFSFLKEKYWSKKLASGYLGYSFGIKPLIADVKALISVINSANEKVRWFRRNQGKIIPVRYTKDLTDDLRPASGVISSDSGHTRRLHLSDFSAEYMAFALVSYDVSQLSDLEIKLRNSIRAFGFDNPLGIVWENIPYSFVVDWVVGVGDWLNAIAPKITLPIKFHDLGWSFRVTRKQEYILEATQSESVGLPITVQKQSGKVYYRFPGLPLSYGSLTTSLPSSNQLVLGLALAIQKYR